MSENDIANYVDIRESLELILEKEVDKETKSTILDNLDDAVGNNAEHLLTYE